MSGRNISMAGRLNYLVDQLNNEIYEEERLTNTSTPVNIVALILLREKIDTIIQNRNVDIHDYFDNQEMSIDHESFQNH